MVTDKMDPIVIIGINVVILKSKIVRLYILTLFSQILLMISPASTYHDSLNSIDECDRTDHDVANLHFLKM